MIAQVKANQPTLLEAVQQASNAQPLSHTCQYHHQRSRIEKREVKVFEAAALLAPSPCHNEWSPLIEAIVQVHRTTDCFDTRSGTWQLRTETAYYVATTIYPATIFAALIRGHWGVENRHHYVRDVTLKEDASRIRCQGDCMKIRCQPVS